MSHRRLRSARFATALAALALLATLGSYARPPIVAADTSPFTDIVGTTFEADIDWLYAEGITVGCAPTLYCPERTVTRGEMASFLARMFDLPATSTDYFRDDDGTTHETDINRLAAAAITMGCTATEFCPGAPVSRGQMASFLVRTIPLTDGAGNDYFRDDDGTTHEADIDRAAAAGITTGCGTWRYCPASPVTRGQMAGYLHRVETPVSPPPHPAPKGLTLFVKTTGSDGANECLVEADPCRTIGQAFGMSAPGDTIDVGAGQFVDHLVVAWDITIRGDPAGTTIDATPTEKSENRHFWVAGGATLTIDLLTLIGGNHSSILVDVGASLTATRSTFVENSGFRGGAIDNGGDTTISHSTFVGNEAYRGGAIFNGYGPSPDQTLTVTGSTFRENVATDQGGAIWNSGVAVVANSTFAGNSADVGAAIRNAATATVVASTVSGNRSGKPFGAISNGGELALADSLVIGNTGGDVAGLITTQLASIVGIPPGLTLADILDPAGLADNGGPTQTIALTDSPSNPAIDQGHAATCAAAPVNGLDQRGLPRTPPCDIGAYELQP